jgi:hypothetical protein
MIFLMMKSYKFKSKRLKYSTASGPASFKTAKPPGNDVNRHSFTMCCIVCCSAPQSQSGMSVKPHLCIMEPHQSWLLWKRFRRTHSCRRSSKPGGMLFGSRIRSPLIGIDVDQCDKQVSDIGQQRQRWEWVHTPNRSTGNQSLRWNVHHRLVQEGSRIFSTVDQFTDGGCFSSKFCWSDVCYRTGSHAHCNCVNFTVPGIIRRALFSCTSILLERTLFNHTGTQYSAVEYTRANEAVRKVSALALQFVPANLHTMWTRTATFCPVFVKWVCQRSIQCDTKVFGMINMLYLSISEIDVQHSVGIMRTEMKDASFGLSWIRLKSPTTKIPIQPFEVSFKSCFTLRKWICLVISQRKMSSAFWNCFDNVSGMSERYRLNSTGANTRPWGSP